jgi:hypothetical protein
MEHPSGKTVQEVEKPSHENHDGCLDGHVMGEKQDGQASRNEIATGDGVGDMLLEVHGVTVLLPQR